LQKELLDDTPILLSLATLLKQRASWKNSLLSRRSLF
jgi:hypothetical protein